MSITGKINVDFQVLKTYDPKTLLIADSSDWKHIEDNTSLLQITLPGGKAPSQLFFDKGKINIVNSSILGITPKACDISELRELPDGIYKIRVVGSPDQFNRERFYLRTERLQLDVDKLYLELGIDFDPEQEDLRELLFNIDTMIKAAEASIRQGNIPKTAMFFKQAKSLLEDYMNCTDCGHNHY